MFTRALATMACRCANRWRPSFIPTSFSTARSQSTPPVQGRGYYPTTWDWQNHPLILRLYEAHGEDLNFAGVILQRIRFETAHGKEVGAQNAARLAKAMGADGALVTWIGGGNAFVDVMLTVQACERNGIKDSVGDL